MKLIEALKNKSDGKDRRSRGLFGQKITVRNKGVLAKTTIYNKSVQTMD